MTTHTTTQDEGPVGIDLVRSVLVEHLGMEHDEIVPEASLRDDLGMDSLDAMELMTTLEDDHDVHVDDETLRSLVTVGDVVTLVNDTTAGAR